MPPATPADTVSDTLLAEIAARGVPVRYAANAIVVSEGDTNDALYIVVSGRLKAFTSSDDGREVVLSEHGPGDCFGELSLDGGRRSASIRALEPSACRVVPGPQLRQFLHEHPDFAMHLVRVLIRRVRRLTEQVHSLSVDNVYARLARLMTEASEPAGDERVARHRMTQQDLAERIGASREMVNRVLKQLFDGGYISLRDGRYVLHRKLPPGW